MKTERIFEIEDYISGRKVVSVQELIDHFEISISTLRRDLNELESRGKIEKIYGGARIIEEAAKMPLGLLTYSEREVKNSVSKNAVARRAAEMISEDDTIFIDTGTSTVPMLRYLSTFEHLTIVTNSVLVLSSSLDLPRFTIIGLPGIVKVKTASLVGEQCIQILDRYRFHKAFMACTTFSLADGACNSTVEEFDIKRKVMARSAEKYLLVDNSKFNRTSLLSFAGPDEFNCVITDTTPDPEYVRYFGEHHVRLVLADKAL